MVSTVTDPLEMIDNIQQLAEENDGDTVKNEEGDVEDIAKDQEDLAGDIVINEEDEVGEIVENEKEEKKSLTEFEPQTDIKDISVKDETFSKDDEELNDDDEKVESRNDDKKDSEKTLFKLRKWLSFNKSSD